MKSRMDKDLLLDTTEEGHEDFGPAVGIERIVAEIDEDEAESLWESVAVEEEETPEVAEVAAAAEYGARFRTDVESFVRREAAEACVVPARIDVKAPAAWTARPTSNSPESTRLAMITNGMTIVRKL